MSKDFGFDGPTERRQSFTTASFLCKIVVRNI